MTQANDSADLPADPPRIEAIAFDLDGTLVDTAAGIANALNGALARAGLPGFELDQVRRWIGGGPDALLTQALAACAVEAEEAQRLAPTLRRDFDAFTLADPLAGGAPFDGIEALLRVLTPRYPLVVVTNKPSVLARAVLVDAGLLRHFGAVFGADEPAWRKPAPYLVERAIAHTRVVPAALLLVGDSAFDIGAAHAAGSPAAWARWGYGGESPLPAPRWTLDAPADLFARLHGQAAATARAG